MKWLPLWLMLGLIVACAGPGAPPVAPAVEAPAVEAPAVEAPAVEPGPTMPPAPAAPATRLLLVRHAEKVDESKDASLTDVGLARAEALRAVVAEAGVTAIYATEYRRTRATAAPLADQLGLELRSYDPASAAERARAIVQQHPGETVLVVGHSPSVPAMVNALLGEERLAKLTRHDELFVVVATPIGADLIALHYGTPDEGPGEAVAAPAPNPPPKPAGAEVPPTALAQCDVLDAVACTAAKPDDCRCEQGCAERCTHCERRCKAQCTTCASRCKPADWECGMACAERLLNCPAECTGPTLQCTLRCMHDASCK